MRCCRRYFFCPDWCHLTWYMSSSLGRTNFIGWLGFYRDWGSIGLCCDATRTKCSFMMAWLVLESIIVCRIIWRIVSWRIYRFVWIISMLVSWIISLIVSWNLFWNRILVSPLELIWYSLFMFVSMTLTFSFRTTLSTVSKGRVPFILIHLSRAPGACIWVYVRAVVIHFPSVNEGKFARKSFFCMALAWKWNEQFWPVAIITLTLLFGQSCPQYPKSVYFRYWSTCVAHQTPASESMSVQWL